MRLNRKFIHADVLNNLIVNYESGSGNAGIQIPQYFVSIGIDASLQNKSGDEQWLVIFNPKIIKKFIIVNPKQVDSNFQFMLPRI